MSFFSKLKNQLILLAIIVVPVVGYFILRTGTNHFKKLPIYGLKELDSVRVNDQWQIDTVYHHIADFKFTNYNGETVSQQNLDSCVYVADFFFSTCKTICPVMSDHMSQLQKAFEKVPDIKFISFTVDPEHDNAEVLNEYAKAHHAIKDKWYLVTGDKKEIYDLARNSYMLNVADGDGGADDFIHSEMFVLVDKEKRIRGIYDGTSEASIDTCVDEIKVLFKEYLAGKKK